MIKTIKLLILIVCLCSFVVADNESIAEFAKNLQFAGTWKVNDGTEEVSVLKEYSLLQEYNGYGEYPIGSGCSVADAKNFANIIATAECGYLLPYGYDYAKHPISESRPGYILQKPAPEPHTMIVVDVQGDEVKVVHSNWAAYSRVSYNIFNKQWLEEQGFLVFKPGEDVVENVFVVEERNPETRDLLGTWRVEVTGEVPYYRVSQGTIVSHSGPGGQIRVSETRTVSNTFSTEAGVSAEVISAKVGFSVTASFSRSLQYWRDVAPGKYGYVDLYYKYMLKNFNVYYDPVFGSEYFVATGKAYQWQAVEFQYRESSN